MVEDAKHQVLKQKNVHKECSERQYEITEQRHCDKGKGALQKPKAVLWSSAFFSKALSQAAYVVLQIQGGFCKKAKTKCIIITGGKQSRNCISRQSVCFKDFILCGQKPAHLYSQTGAWKAGDKSLIPVLCKGKGQTSKEFVKVTETLSL